MSNSSDQLPGQTWRALRLFKVFAVTFFLLVVISVALFGFPAFNVRANTPGQLSVEIIAAYNLVVDSNVMAPSTYAPSVATVGGKVCNTHATDTVTGVQVYIGNYNGGAGSTPGIYPARNSATDPAFSDPLQYQYIYSTGNYSFIHVGGSMGVRDGARYVGTLAPGQCQVQYWHFTYPRRSNGSGPTYTPNAGNQPVWGQTRLTSDDLALGFDIWTTAPGGVNATKHQTMTMRNEISAMANKIKPNPDGQWFNTTNPVTAGEIITTNGILYELGVINQGFDNDGDFTPDFNAWVQPIGDPAYDPSCFRLIRTSGVLTVSRGAGNPDLIIPFVDKLYFTHMPPDNNGVRGLVFYTFLALNGTCSTALSPYQEVASGSYNEKFNGDFGTGIPPVISTAPLVTIDKNGTPTVQLGQWITYTIKANNTSPDRSAGMPLFSTGLVLSDSIPANTTFVAGSIITDSNTTILYSTDGGVTWSESLPAGTITNIQVRQNNPLGPLASTTFTFSVQVANSLPANQLPVITNCAAASFGEAAPFARDCADTNIQGPYRGGHYVWRDENRDTITNTGELFLNNIPLRLYYDANGNGIIDASESVMSQTQTGLTSQTGYYTFSNLYTGTYIVAVDANSPNIPFGYRATTPITHILEVSSVITDYKLANFGFGPTLSTTKSLIGNTFAGDYATYRIGVSNLRPGGGTTTDNGECLVQSWASNASTPNSPKNFVNAAAATGAPNGTYASADFRTGANKTLDTFSYNKGTLPGIINRVVAAWTVYVQPGVTDDFLDIGVYSGTATSGTRLVTDTVKLHTPNINNYIGPNNAGVITTLLNSPAGGWSWNVINNLTGQLVMGKASSGDDSIFYVDGAGMLVYFNGACPAAEPNDIMTIVPLTDTFDTGYLTFVSATPAPSIVNASTGVITWTNIGPLNPGQTANVEVIFSVRHPITPAVSINNSTCVTGTLFMDNGPANNACATARGVISPAGYITGVVWSDANTNRWQGTTGFDGSDYRISNTQMDLYACQYVDPDGNLYGTYVSAADHTGGGNQSCAGIGTGQNTTDWVLVSTKNTDLNGYYGFTGLPDAWYYVKVVTTTLPAGFASSASPSPSANGAGVTCTTTDTCSTWPVTVTSAPINLASPFVSIRNASIITQVNFGYSGLAIVYGTVWHDVNGDGTRQSTDPGLDNSTAGVTVTLYNVATGGISGTTQTNANGFYQFTGLPAGAYTITVNTGTLPGTGWTETAESGPGTIGPLDNSMQTVNLVAGQISGSYDFGYHKGGTLEIGDLVYYDFDGNGYPTSTVSSNIEGIPTVTLRLYLDNGNDLYDSSDGVFSVTTTSITGSYLFTGLPAGTYFVVVDPTTLPSNLTQTGDPDESGKCSICNNRGKAVLSSTSVYTMDFGYQPHGSGAIGDTVWRDMNGDGIQAGPQETGIAGVLVTLTIDFNGDGNYVPVMTRTTDANGYYLFNDLSQVLLPQGKYRVYVDSSSSNLPKDVYGLPYIPSTPISHTTSITISQVYLNADFGFMPLGAIGDTVYWDANGNAQQDWAEVGVPNITISLSDSGGNVIASATTDSNGKYLFTGLVPGTYTVTVSNPPATLTGDPDTNGVPCAISPLAAYCDHKTSTVINPGTIFLGADFGYQPSGVIGDFVFRDLDGDGLQDPGEPGIPSVVVTVTNSATGTTYTTTTDIDGRYSFSNLPVSSTWYVTFTQPSNMAPTISSGTAISNGNGSVGLTATVIINSGGQVNSINGNSCTDCSLHIDSGFVLNGSYTVSGHTFFDSAGNGGIYSSTIDSPYSGIPVYLFDANHVLIGTTATDASGAYTFTNLPGGGVGYTVSADRNVPKLTDLALTADYPDVPGACGACNNYNTFTIGASSITDRDFGFYAALDFGDLPATYNITHLSNEGPRHIVSSLYLGAGVSTEGDGTENANATSDTLDDGVSRVMTDKWVAGNTVRLTVTVTGNGGYLVGWFDWNGLNNFSLVTDTVTFGTVSPGTQVLNVAVPAGYPTQQTVNARFRLYNGQPLQASPQGAAVGGEVEDYQWLFGPTAVTVNSLSARTETGDIVMLPIFIVMGVGAALLIVWAKRHRVA